MLLLNIIADDHDHGGTYSISVDDGLASPLVTSHFFGACFLVSCAFFCEIFQRFCCVKDLTVDYY